MSDAPDEPPLTHLDAAGRARMVDVSDKAPSVREAVASGCIRMRPETVRRLIEGDVPKGDVLAVARVAGIGAAKRCWELIPLCHPVRLSGVEVRFEPRPDDGALLVEARARATDRTGVEMEALAAVSVAALTVYDMLKAVERGMVIEQVRLDSKTGGRRDYRR